MPDDPEPEPDPNEPTAEQLESNRLTLESMKRSDFSGKGNPAKEPYVFFVS